MSDDSIPLGNNAISLPQVEREASGQFLETMKALRIAIAGLAPSESKNKASAAFGAVVTGVAQSGGVFSTLAAGAAADHQDSFKITLQRMGESSWGNEGEEKKEAQKVLEGKNDGNLETLKKAAKECGIKTIGSGATRTSLDDGIESAKDNLKTIAAVRVLKPNDVIYGTDQQLRESGGVHKYVQNCAIRYAANDPSDDLRSFLDRPKPVTAEMRAVADDPNKLGTGVNGKKLDELNAAVIAREQQMPNPQSLVPMRSSRRSGPSELNALTQTMPLVAPEIFVAVQPVTEGPVPTAALNEAIEYEASGPDRDLTDSSRTLNSRKAGRSRSGSQIIPPPPGAAPQLGPTPRQGNTL